ncbi:MAG: hypothetical protein U0744_17215 [Gemmataceae bacterium]
MLDRENQDGLMAEPTCKPQRTIHQADRGTRPHSATLGDHRAPAGDGAGLSCRASFAEKRHVALKLLKPELAANQTALLRFERELAIP